VISRGFDDDKRKPRAFRDVRFAANPRAHAAGVVEKTRMLRNVAHASPADGFPSGCALIEIHVADVKHLFHSLDPTPFRERDLDPKAEEFIAGWARELHPNVPLGLRVHVDHDIEPDGTTMLQGAVRDYFAERAAAARKRLRLLFRTGRVSLVIGLAVVAGSILSGDVVETMLRQSQWGSVIRESLLIGGWVAMWRPLEIFLYEWWGIRDEARLFDRLSAMTVRVDKSRE
jgi:hypothetical protein